MKSGTQQFQTPSIEGGKVYGFRGITWDATLNNNEGGGFGYIPGLTDDSHLA